MNGTCLPAFVLLKKTSAVSVSSTATGSLTWRHRSGLGTRGVCHDGEMVVVTSASSCAAALAPTLSVYGRFNLPSLLTTGCLPAAAPVEAGTTIPSFPLFLTAVSRGGGGRPVPTLRKVLWRATTMLYGRHERRWFLHCNVSCLLSCTALFLAPARLYILVYVARGGCFRIDGAPGTALQRW